MVNEHPYQVAGEVGRFTFSTHTAVDAQGESYNTATAFFPDVHGREWYRTRGFKEIALLYGSIEESYRKTARLINRVRHQPEATPVRTLRHTSESEGQQIAAAIGQKATKLLKMAGFTAEGVPQRATTQYGSKTPYRLTDAGVAEAVAACGADPAWHADLGANPVGYEDPERTTQITIDDVGVKEQKAVRGRPVPAAAVDADRPETATAKAARKYIHNTIIHVQKAAAVYTLNGQGTVATLPLLIPLLWFNDLLRDNLVFFVDGQRTWHAAIAAGVAWFRQAQIILDWYHLELKCQQQLSLALASLTAARQNGEAERWLKKGQIRFKLVA